MASIVRRGTAGDIVHAALTAIVGAGALPVGPRLVVSVTAARLEWLGISGVALKSYERALRKARVVDCLVPEVREELLAQGLTAQKLRVGPGSFVDSNAFRPGTKEPLVSFVARFVDLKQPLLFVAAATRVASVCDEARFVMVGNGPLMPAVTRMIDENGLGARFDLIETCDTAPVLARSAVFASLMTLENYPSQSLLEAMAAENAIVATDVGRTSLLVDGTTGVRVDSDPGALARAIIGLLEDPKTAAEMGGAGRRLVERDFRIGPYLDYLTGLYTELQ